MRRGGVLLVIALACAASLAQAQAPGKVHRVAGVGPVCDVFPLDAAKGTPWESVPLHPFDFTLLQSLGDLKVVFERRCFRSNAQLAQVATELAGLNLDAAITWEDTATRYLKSV